MSNTFTSVVKQHWANALQDNLEKSLVAMELAEMVDIPNGTTKNLPRVSFQPTVDYTKYTQVTFKDITTANDQLVINTTPMVPFNIDALDVEDNYINMTPEIIRNAGYKLKERIDGDFLAEILNASWKYDNSGFGVNTGTLTPIALTTGSSQNISTVFGMAKAGLTNFGANAGRLALVVDSFTLVAINTLGLEAGFNKADEAYARGFRGTFGGMPVYEASNLTTTTTLDLATNPTAGDYIYVQGVKFTFVSSIGTTAGNVLIGVSADATAQNLVTLVNAPATTTATGVALSADNIARFSGITAADGTDLVTFTSKAGALLASSSMTAAANDFQAQAINCAIMEKGAVKMALRDSVEIKQVEAVDTLVTNYMVYSRYGLKTPQSGKDRMCRIVIQSVAAES
jgi:hypothetical protein